jgi:alpha-tubulin suppressor-like RCC1 family protein
MSRASVFLRVAVGLATLLGLTVLVTVPPATAASVHVTALAAGQDQSLALLSNGTVMAWGGNVDGDFGIGSNVPSLIPVKVPGLTGVKAIAAAEDSTSYALLSNGTVMVWGGDDYGQYGIGTVGWHSATPIKVPGLRNVTAISASDGTVFARLKNGTVMAWGANSEGQLGQGTFSGAPCGCVPQPTAVTGLSAVSAIVAGNAGDGLAILHDGTLESWGNNGNGQLGDGSVPKTVSVPGCCTDSPEPVTSVTGVKAVTGGGWGTLALLKNGTVEAWGSNANGELGDGTVATGIGCECTGTPQGVPGLTGVRAVAAGDFWNLALLKNGNVMAWGDNKRGWLGNGTFTSNQCDCISQPVQTNISGVVAIAVGTEHSLALLKNGTVMAWGANDWGQLGDGTTNDSDVPVEVTGLGT